MAKTSQVPFFVSTRELPPKEAALVLREAIKGGNPFARYYQVTAESSLEDFERTVVSHPVFVLESNQQHRGQHLFS